MTDVLRPVLLCAVAVIVTLVVLLRADGVIPRHPVRWWVLIALSLVVGAASGWLVAEVIRFAITQDLDPDHDPYRLVAPTSATLASAFLFWVCVIRQPWHAPPATTGERRPTRRLMTRIGASAVAVVVAAAATVTAIQPRDRFPHELRVWLLPQDVAFSPDGRLLATLHGWVQLWDVAGRHPLESPIGLADMNDAGLVSMRFSPDGRTIAAEDLDSRVRIFDVQTRQEIGTPMDPDWLGETARPVFSPDGRTIVTGAGPSLRLWDVGSHQQIGEPITPTGLVEGHQVMDNTIFALAVSPDGRTAAAGGTTRTSDFRNHIHFDIEDRYPVHVWDAESRQQIGAPLEGHTAPVVDIVFSPDGRTIATASADRTIRLWDSTSHRQIGEPLPGHANAVDSIVRIAFSPDGRLLASAGDTAARLWNVADRRLIREQDIPDPCGISFSPDSRTLAVCAGRPWVQIPDGWTPGGRGSAVHLWDVSSSP
ncbi:WD40 repeat domain-containing protein [Pseudonocardia sp. TRM90224]|uniref:WD40 repeat domain-containing protein n=1 Tax=Pseudonocardia sp. TRM90224 TaxID=2812678 RepID=UPI001E2917AE|nr:hypothetical protein [Pseudonocardia sp. TRM90224]